MKRVIVKHIERDFMTSDFIVVERNGYEFNKDLSLCRGKDKCWYMVDVKSGITFISGETRCEVIKSFETCKNDYKNWKKTLDYNYLVKIFKKLENIKNKEIINEGYKKVLYFLSCRKMENYYKFGLNEYNDMIAFFNSLDKKEKK